MEKLKISISTPTYNSEKTIEETITSIITQGYENLEYNIIDGLSSDKTLDIVNKYKKYITNVVSEKDNGISDAFNKGVRLSSGDLIGNINSDDFLLPGALKYIQENIKEETDVIYGNALRLFPDGRTTDYKPLPINKLYQCMALVHPAVFVRKRAYQKFGLFDLKYKGCMDRELMLRMYHGGAKFQYLDRALVVYRMGGVSHKNYFNIVLPEGKEISIKYGMSPTEANFYYIKGYIKMNLLRLLGKI